MPVNVRRFKLVDADDLTALLVFYHNSQKMKKDVARECSVASSIRKAQRRC